MFNNNSIEFLLKMEDPNIDFSNSTQEFSKIKGIETMLISANLRNKQNKCP